MRLVGCEKIALAVFTALCCAGSLLAQSPIIVVSSPTYGQVTMGLGSGGGALAGNVYGISPEHTTSYFMPDKYATSCPGKGIVGRAFVSGEISCGAQSSVGGSYWLGLYGDVVPGSKVLVKLQSNLSINWNRLNQENYTYYTFVSTGSGVNRMSQSVLVSGSITKNEEVSAVVVPHVNTANTIDGKVMYRLGTVYIYGKVESTSGTNADYSGAITGFSARYIGKALSYVSGGGKTVRTGEALPQPVSFKVIDEITNSPVPDIPIAFSLTDPNGSATSLGTAQTESPSGIAYKAVTLGDVPGVYTITATCPDNVCVAGARVAATTATARGKALTCDGGICYLHGRLPWQFSNPFRVMVIDKLDGKPVKEAKVSYSIISFTDTNNLTRAGDNGARMSLPDTQTDSDGNSRSYFVPGPSSGTYVIQASCLDCTEGEKQILRAGVHTHDSREMPATAAGDPDANEDDCPSGCCPVTPVLRVKMVNPPNDGVSFTSAAGENGIGLDALVLPQCLEENEPVRVTWEVKDAPGDYMYSGTPTQPKPGPISSFVVGSGTFPVPTDIYKRPIGRPLPLAYKVTASITRNGETTQTSAETRQDEIDKCRQEYIDFGIQLDEVPRTAFTIGTHTEYSQDVRDCYAYIYPTEEANKVDRIRSAGHVLRVSSGYRSPRSQGEFAKDPSRVKYSTHLYGQAVDIAPPWSVRTSPESTAEAWKDLWTATGNTCPKTLETRVRGYVEVMKYCNRPAAEPIDGKFYPGTDEKMYPKATCIHLGDSTK